MAKKLGKSVRSNSRKRLTGIESLEDRVVLTATGTELPAEALITSPQVDTVHVASQQTSNEKIAAAVPRIVNGEQTDEFPAVGVVNGQCTGTLISPTHVLTAAHCVEGVGNTQGTFEVNGQTYNTVRVISHPQYNPNDFGAGYDIAIMELDRPVEGVQPMQILRTTPQVGQILTLVGFGEGGTSTGGFDPDDDGKQVGQTELEEVTQTHIAWNFDSHNEANTAPGDSGGPAFVNQGGQLLIAGVTSGGNGNAQSLGDYSFDTRVDVFADWIDGIVGNVNPDPVNPDPVDPDPVDPDPVDPDPVDPAPGDGGDFDEFSPEQEAQYELDTYDTDGNGKLDMGELVYEFLDYGGNLLSAQIDAQSLINDYDTSGDNQLSYDELVVSWGGQSGGEVDPDPIDPVDPTPGPIDPGPIDPGPVDPAPNPGDGGVTPESQAQDELNLYDSDGDGYLSLSELVNEFMDYGDSIAVATDNAQWLLNDFDTDGDNRLSYSELVVSWGGEDFGTTESTSPQNPSNEDDWTWALDDAFADDNWWYF